MKVTRRLLEASVAACLLGGACPSEAAMLFNFPDFSSTAGLTLVGSATPDGNQLQITPAAESQGGAAYSTTAVTLGPGATFSTTFQFQFTNPGGWVGSPADGIAFVLAALPGGLGTAGGGMGYGTVDNSVAIEFDTYDNTPYVNDGSSSNHVAILENGHVDATGDLNLVNPYGVSHCLLDPDSYLAAGCMSNGHIWTATIGYDGSNLSATVKDGASPAYSIYSSLPIDIASLIGTTTAYVGFTGATGGGYEKQNILSWQLANDTSLGPTIPEPATLSLLGMGLAGLAGMRRRKCA